MSGDTTLLLLGLLTLLAVTGAAGFYCGWRAAQSYLSAARAVSDVSNAAISQANDFSNALDKNEARLTELTHAVKANAETLGGRQQSVEEAVMALLAGLQRAGLARSERATPRQHGESRDPEAT